MSIGSIFKTLMTPAPQEPVFVRNIDTVRQNPAHFNVVGGLVGRPQATEWYTADRLEHDGVAGLYRTGRRDPVLVATR